MYLISKCLQTIYHLPKFLCTKLDFHFGQLREELYLTSYTTANNLVNTYWLQFLEETTGRDSRIVTVELSLPAALNLNCKSAVPEPIWSTIKR